MLITPSSSCCFGVIPSMVSPTVQLWCITEALWVAESRTSRPGAGHLEGHRAHCLGRERWPPPPLLSLSEPSKHCLLACISQQTVLHLLHYMSTGPFSRRSTLTHSNILLPLSRCKHQNFFQCSKIVSILTFHFCFCFKATVMIRCFANIPCIQKIFNI